MSEQKVSDATKEADRRDAHKAHQADREPTADEEARAEELEVDESTAESYQDMADKGADHPGEGRITQ